MAATISKTNAKKLREQRADVIQKAQAYLAEHEGEDGLLSVEDQAVVDKMLADAKNCGEQAAQREKLEGAVNGLDKVGDDPSAGAEWSSTIDPGAGFDDDDARRAAEARAGRNRSPVRIRQGLGADCRPRYLTTAEMAAEDRAAWCRDMGDRCNADYHQSFCRALGNRKLTAEQFAALQSDNPTEAGYLVASEQFASELLKEVDDLLFIRRYASVYSVPTATSLGIRCRTAKLSTFAWSTELTVSTADSTLAYGKRVLTPHPLTGQILISRDLLRRAILSVEGEVRGELARDAGEVQEDAFLTGSGAEQPLGLFTASADGISTSRDVSTGSATGVTFDGLVTAKYSLKSQYRSGGARTGARWLFHRDAILKIALLKDGAGHPLLRPGRGLVDEDPDMILGLPVDESERVPNTFTASQYVGMLGNYRYYAIADALDMEIQVLDQLDATTNQIRYIARLKTDGMPTLAEAFVRLQTAAS